MFSQACVKNSVHRGGVCMVKGDMHGGEACMARGHAWQGGKCGGGCAWQGGMHGGGNAWQGACVAGEMATAVDGTHPTGMHSCPTISSRKEMGVELAITSLLSNDVLILAKSPKSK